MGMSHPPNAPMVAPRARCRSCNGERSRDSSVAPGSPAGTGMSLTVARAPPGRYGHYRRDPVGILPTGTGRYRSVADRTLSTTAEGARTHDATDPVHRLAERREGRRRGDRPA